jgi:hypothetical protein
MMNGFWFSPFVVAQRLPLILLQTLQNPLSSGAGSDKLESHLMVTEKWSAMLDGAHAAWSETLHSGLSINLALLKGEIPKASLCAAGAPSRIANEALKPAEDAVLANAKRLMRG